MNTFTRDVVYNWENEIYIARPRFMCERELVRDYDRETRMHDGWPYYRSTGRLIVTWYDGSVTYIETSQPNHSPVVIDCGYDESLPF